MSEYFWAVFSFVLMLCAFYIIWRKPTLKNDSPSDSSIPIIMDDSSEAEVSLPFGDTFGQLTQIGDMWLDLHEIEGIRFTRRTIMQNINKTFYLVETAKIDFASGFDVELNESHTTALRSLMSRKTQ